LDGERWRNVAGLSFQLRGWREALSCHDSSAILVHLGADVDTTAPFSEALWENNVEFSLQLFERPWARIVYASSAAVYGAEEGDFRERLFGLKPLNAYAFTKLELDKAVAAMEMTHAYGLRLFNVYGPNETHKGAMASVVSKALLPPSEDGILIDHDPLDHSRIEPRWALFKSHRERVADGEQKRDFVHVEDVCRVIAYFALNPIAPEAGVYNVGTGTARTFKELVQAINPTLGIKYRPMPENLRAQYQYHTQADLRRLRAAGYDQPFMAIEDGVRRMT
jgi:ADP-L-glycero-D-manno-heptose 6-epimerase